jgi:hypothetical protein
MQNNVLSQTAGTEARWMARKPGGEPVNQFLNLPDRTQVRQGSGWCVGRVRLVVKTYRFKRHTDYHSCIMAYAIDARIVALPWLFLALYLFMNNGQFSPESRASAGGVPASAVAVLDDPLVPASAPEYIKQVVHACGAVCRIDDFGTPALFFNHTTKHVNCMSLVANKAIDTAMAEPVPPQMAAIPAYLMDAFTHGGKVAMQLYQEGVLNERYLGGSAATPVWEAAVIDDWVRQCEAGTLQGTYGAEYTKQLREALRQAKNIVQGRVLVIGSERPWVEACLLYLGASHVTTLEYGGIVSNHPKVSTITPENMRANAHTYQNYFDAVVSFSSLEHSGLGRYGDALNPWGDRQAMARAWCMTRPGGQLALGLPVHSSGNDFIMYNAHRLYGPVQLPHVMANWKQQWQSEIFPHSLYPHRVWVCEK